MLKNHFSNEQHGRNAKVALLTGLLSLLCFILLGRLFFLQVYEYEENSRLSQENRMRQHVIKAPRGEIEDRLGNILVRNRPSYHICILYHKIPNISELKQSLLNIQDEKGESIFDSTVVEQQLQRGRWRKYKPLMILEDAPIEIVSLMEERADELTGVITQVEARRSYPYGTLAAHALGYTGRISPKEFKKRESLGYSKSDRIGKKGLENYYEKDFRGQDGVEYIEVDALGRRLGAIEGMPKELAKHGAKIITTLDLELQKVAEEAFPDSVKGAVVAIDPRNGEVLAMVSRPRLNPNIFSLDSLSKKRAWANVALDSDAPLNNRAVVGLYPPGSLFKFFTSIAGMQEGISAYTHPYKSCHGAFRFGRRLQKCWKASGHGNVNMIDALKGSCDVYFYQLGLQIGMDPINRVSAMFGLERKSGIDLPIEKRGLLMDSIVYNKRFKRLGWKWTRGQILHLSIGQGELVTPLQMANSFAALGSMSALYKPRLVKAIIGADGRVLKYTKPEILNEIHLADSIKVAMKKALYAVVNEQGGTARAARLKNVVVGGKTGSAENPHGEKTHAWFGAVAPLDKPRIAIAVLAENAGHGGSIAAPVAGKILRHFFREEEAAQ